MFHWKYLAKAGKHKTQGPFSEVIVTCLFWNSKMRITCRFRFTITILNLNEEPGTLFGGQLGSQQSAEWDMGMLYMGMLLFTIMSLSVSITHERHRHIASFKMYNRYY
jgi:hypothetical protein